MINTKNIKKTGKRKRASYFVKSETDEQKFGTNKLKAIIYTRVSSDGQVTQGHGLESQESACRERCQKQSGLEVEVIKVFREEGVSGKVMNRQVITEAITFLEKENKKYTKIHYFIVTDVDRIARPDDIAEAFTLEQRIESLGVKIVTVNNKRDTETDEGKFLHTIQYAIAGLERRKILRRIMNGKLSSLKSGGRPFPAPPLGYIREKLGDKKYVDKIDEIKGAIIKEGLDLYAYNPLFTKSQLHNFWISKGLVTGKTVGKLHISFIDKVFKDYRLYFYAGYVYYPDRGVETPIKGNHNALISLELVEKILEKESYRKPNKTKSPNFDKSLEDHPLKGMITCLGCGRKLGCYASRGNGGIYYYYNCANRYCLDRINVRKEVIENDFENFIIEMKHPKSTFTVLKTAVLYNMESRRNEQNFNANQIQGQLLSINTKMKNIEEKILSIQQEGLIKKLEKDWSALEKQKEDLECKVTAQVRGEENLEKTLLLAEQLFIDPVGFWRKSNYEIRQLLSMVWFGGNLHYKKNQGYRTTDTTGMNYLFSSLGELNNRVMQHGGISSNQKVYSGKHLECFIESLIEKSNYINAIFKVIEMRESYA